MGDGEVEVRTARSGEGTAARSILDAAMLEVDDEAFDRGELLVARETDRVLGALVLDGSEVVAVAVRPNRRGQGIGSALLRGAAERRSELTASFDSPVRPFYESLGFEIECEDGRCRGRLA